MKHVVEITADGPGFGVRPKPVITEGAVVEINGTGNCVMAHSAIDSEIPTQPGLDVSSGAGVRAAISAALRGT